MKWYQVKARFDKVQEDGREKKVSEHYLVQAFTFSEAERAIQEEIAPLASGEFDIVAIARKNYDEIIASKLDNEISDKWYKCKVNFITLNERNGKEGKTSRCFLVQSASALTAHKRVDKFMEGAMSDYEVEQVYETKIIDVFKVATNEEEDGLYF